MNEERARNRDRPRRRERGRLSTDGLTILIEEWQHCEEGIARYDALEFQMRGWAITIVAAIVAASVSVRSPLIASIGIPVTLLFWWLEAVHDTYQKVFIDRSHRIQKLMRHHVRGKLHHDGFRPPLLGEMFEARWNISHAKRWRIVWQHARYPNIWLTYAVLGCMCFAFALRYLRWGR